MSCVREQTVSVLYWGLTSVPCHLQDLYARKEQPRRHFAETVHENTMWEKETINK